MLAAYSVNKSVVLFNSNTSSKGFRLERCKLGDEQWKTFTGKRFALLDSETETDENENVEDTENENTESEENEEEIVYCTVEEATEFIKSLGESDNETYTLHIKDDEETSCESLYEALLALPSTEDAGPRIILDLEETILDINDNSLQGNPIGVSGVYGYALKEITLPKNLKTIGDRAISVQASLEKVVFPESLEVIEQYAFNRCLSLKEVDFSKCENLKKLSDCAFQFCESLEKVDLSVCKNLDFIGQDAFHHNTLLKEVLLYEDEKKVWGHDESKGICDDASTGECFALENPSKDNIIVVPCFSKNAAYFLTPDSSVSLECENDDCEEEGCNGKTMKNRYDYHWYRIIDEDKVKEAIKEKIEEIKEKKENLKETIKEKIEEIIEIDKPFPVGSKFIDTFDLEDTLYIYRCIEFDAEDPEDKDYEYSNNVRVSGDAQVGYTFGNYKPAPGTWGEVVTPDDLRYTYLWGTDFKATNGQSFTDEQIKFFIDASVQDIARQLDITIVKQKIRSDAEERGLEKGKDYDIDEAVYDFRWARIARYGFIKTRQRPILKLHKLSLLSRLASMKDITRDVIVDKTKGILKFMKRPIKPTQTSFGLQTAINQYGSETIGFHLFYSIDYDAGYESSDDVPADLREIVAKHASVNLLNVVGDGLMSGFSSSSLSMDGLSESFSSTQSATSAYFGARIKEYKDDIDDYIKANKNKFGHIVIGCL